MVFNLYFDFYLLFLTLVFISFVRKKVDCNKGPSSDKENFAAFVRELRQAFAPKGLLLSAAVSPSKKVIDEGMLKLLIKLLYCEIDQSRKKKELLI